MADNPNPSPENNAPAGGDVEGVPASAPQTVRPDEVLQGSAPETVRPDEIFKISGASGKVEEGTYTQRAGMKLAKWVGVLGSAVTLIILAKWIWMTWCVNCTNIPSTASTEQADMLVKNYKALQEQAFDSASKMFDAIVGKVLLPVFTSILGYIFGARHASEGAANSNAGSTAG